MLQALVAMPQMQATAIKSARNGVMDLLAMKWFFTGQILLKRQPMRYYLYA